MNQEQLRNLDTFINTYGNDLQIDMAIEECSELTKALLKYRRKQYGDDGFDRAELREAIIDEIADVQIMIAQLQIIYNCIGEVDDRIEYKIKRQMERIEARKYGLPHTPFGKDLYSHETDGEHRGEKIAHSRDTEDSI